MISKNHHALVDGVAGIDLGTVLLDFVPSPQPLDTGELDPWQPQLEPSAAGSCCLQTRATGRAR